MDSVLVLLRVLLALACVVGLIWVLGRRLGAGRAPRASREPAVRVVGRQAVGRHAGVAVVAVGQRRLLLGYGDQQVNLLTELAPVVELEPVSAETPVPSVVATAPGGTWATAGSVPAPKAGTRPAVPGAVAAALGKRPASGMTRGGAGAALHGSVLSGSVLSPQTWRQALHALQDRTVRR